jgi:hypothetical protein
MSGTGDDDDPTALPPEPSAAAQRHETPVPETSGQDGMEPGLRRRARVSTRDLLVGLLVVLACLGVLVSGVAFWAHYTVLDTDGYLDVVGPVAQNPRSVRALSEYIAAEAMVAADLQARTAEALPPRGVFLAAPIAEAVEAFIEDQTFALLSTPQAYEWWLDINRVSHTQIVALLRGETSLAYIQGDDVKLNILPLMSQVLVRLDDRLPGALPTRFDPPRITAEMPPDEARRQLSSWLGRPLPPDSGQVTLITSEALGPAQTAVRWFDRLVIIVPVVTLVLVAAAIWLSRRRRRTIIELGVGVAVALVVLHVVIARLTEVLLARLQTETAVGVARDIVNASLGPLTTIVMWLVIAGVVVAAAAWLAGRRDVKDAVVMSSRRVASTRGDIVRASPPIVKWSSRHVDALRVAGLAVALVLLLLFATSWILLLLLLLLAVAFQLALSWIAAGWPFAHRRDALSRVS